MFNMVWTTSLVSAEIVFSELAITGTGSRFVMIHHPSRESAARMVKVLRRYNWKFAQRVILLPGDVARYIDFPFVAENNLYIGNITNVNEKQFQEVITEILGHPLVAYQLIQGVLRYVLIAFF